MDPRKISAFIIVSLIVLFAFTYLSRPFEAEDGSVKNGFVFTGGAVKYPTTETFWMSGALAAENAMAIDSIVANIETAVVDEESEANSLPAIVVPDYSKIDTSKIERLHWPEQKKVHIDKLRKQLSSKECRIIHYGDSQLEGDRISAYVRNRLQGLYGGVGPGFVPVKQLYHQLKAKVEPSDNWLRFAAFDPNHDRFPHEKYGAFTSISRFTPYVERDSVDLDTLPLVQGSIQIAVAGRGYSRLNKFTRIGLHYGHVQTPTAVSVYENGTLILEDSLENDLGYHQLRLDLDTPPKDLRMEFSSKISPDFYGVTLDGDSGVSLDNVAMRGASGTVFAKLNTENFREMIGTLSPKVFIFQYGGNSVPYLTGTKAIDNYANYVLSNLKWVRRTQPDASVIFIGPSDMATLENGNYISYRHLPYLNEKLRQVCLENGVAYWSMFDAMGGEGSMVHWVDQELAKSDYTHFSSTGTKVISELFFTALYLDLMK